MPNRSAWTASRRIRPRYRRGRAAPSGAPGRWPFPQPDPGIAPALRRAALSVLRTTARDWGLDRELGSARDHRRRAALRRSPRRASRSSRGRDRVGEHVEEYAQLRGHQPPRRVDRLHRRRRRLELAEDADERPPRELRLHLVAEHHHQAETRFRGGDRDVAVVGRQPAAHLHPPFRLVHDERPVAAGREVGKADAVVLLRAPPAHPASRGARGTPAPRTRPAGSRRAGARRATSRPAARS